ncbi:MAG: D-cysteine desulfhydrase family protein [Prolixibacteraceae bacterium]
MKKKLSLGFFPTPLYELKNLSKQFNGHRIFIKRDDHNGVATGGNKIRKLEYLLQDAFDQGCNTVITAGAQQSNHCRLTAAACAQTGLKCHLLLGGEEPEEYNGNLLLSGLLGAKIHFAGNHRKGEDMTILAEKLKKEGNKPYIIPYGGSNKTGALGYANAVLEIREQLKAANLSMDYIVFASSSGGTHAGLLAGCELYQVDSKIVGINIDKDETQGKTLEEIIRELVPGVLEFHNRRPGSAQPEIMLIRDYDKGGYGIVTEQERKAIKTLAETEGILLDPVYTARAFFGMMDLMEKKLLTSGSNVLFLHTGGIPAMFCYAKDLLPSRTDS